jgi:hypothetical protein
MRSAGHSSDAARAGVLLAAHQAKILGADLSPDVIADESETSVLLTSAGTIASGPAALDQRAERSRHLAIAIRQRIESRLSGRVRDLVVRVVGETVVLEGRCATFYTKQLAQHAAIAVLEREKLVNAITVSTP